MRVLLLRADLPADPVAHQHRHERHRQQRGGGHRVGLGERQRPEQPPLLRLSVKTGMNETVMTSSE